MEPTNLMPQIIGSPLPLEINRKLLIFAVSSMHKDIDVETLVAKKQISLVLGIAYSRAEAQEAVRHSLINLGLNPEDFRNAQAIFREVGQMIEMPRESILPETQTITEEAPVNPRQKAVSDLVAYVRYVFNAVGTKEEIKTVEGIIDRFISNQKKL